MICCFPDEDDLIDHFQNYTPSDNDIVLLNKFYVASAALAGSPMVFCPSEFLEKLDPMGPVHCANRVRFSVRQEKVFLKTAKKLQEAPWRMQRASCYLNTLVAHNAAGCADWLPPDCSFACHAGQVNCPKELPEPPSLAEKYQQPLCDLLAFSVKTPAPVTVTGLKKRPAAAAAAAGPALKRPAAFGVFKKRPAGVALPDDLDMPSAEQAHNGAPPHDVETGAPVGSGIPRRIMIGQL